MRQRQVLLTFPLWEQNTSAAFFIQYGRGAVQGNVAYDTLTVGQPPFRITKQGVGLARDASDAFTDASCDGLFVRPSAKCRASLPVLFQPV